MEQVNQKNNEQRMIRRGAVKSFCLTLFLLIALFGEVLLVLPVLSPKSAIAFFETMGMKTAVLSTQEMQYNRTGKPEHLYNLVVTAKSQNKTKKVLKYANELVNHKDFAAFEKAFDKYALENAKKDKLYLVASVKNYLLGIQVEAKYTKNREEAKELSLQCFEEDNLSSFYFSYYVDSVLADKKLTEEQKVEYMRAVASTQVKEKTVLKHLQSRYSANVPTDLLSGDLLTLQQLWHTKQIELILSEVCGISTTQIESELVDLATAISAKIS